MPDFLHRNIGKWLLITTDVVCCQCFLFTNRRSGKTSCESEGGLRNVDPITHRVPIGLYKYGCLLQCPTRSRRERVLFTNIDYAEPKRHIWAP